MSDIFLTTIMISALRGSNVLLSTSSAHQSDMTSEGFEGGFGGIHAGEDGKSKAGRTRLSDGTLSSSPSSSPISSPSLSAISSPSLSATSGACESTGPRSVRSRPRESATAERFSHPGSELLS
jgi:hypothetical protein